MVNKEAFESLPPDLQAIVETAAEAANQKMLDEYTAHNNAALKQLVEEHGVELRRLPDDVLAALYRYSEEVLRELAESDEFARRAYESMTAFRAEAMAYHRISEQAYYEVRQRVINGE
jgi:TRAP-type mannitol/chloroaromatic compound transport system substrate-binding protein